ncbi:sugar porter family MFS transporter [Chitinophagaceae bacterium LB-8]|uniref:Sugar porter family MFS transporter n=1 Tax=Paraflavisolibacter caeni TaxID=2982496 RepID=A0A9X2XUA2_9BACT|nr:sugar porter family MFS transporter [Paraflavisolibacter caeni]MCU7548695.1 sugar porter family MFS transporter [Paraflavisolibacter caeni]
MNKRKVFLWSLIVALGGFLFGFDTAVISGAEQSIQKYWNLSPVEHGLTVSIALIGTVLGSLLGSIPSDVLGRRSTLMIIAALYLLSSLGTALATNWYLFLLFRFAGGLGVGASSVTAPVYISEIAPAQKRGRLVALFQFNIVLGIVFSYLSNYLIGQEGATAWRWMLGVQAFPSLLFLVLLQLVPESPRWLISYKGKIEEARAILQVVSPDSYNAEVESIKNTNLAGEAQGYSSNLLSRKYKFPIFLAVTFAVFNQLSGINAIIYYAPRIFEMTGLGRSYSLLSTLGIGAVNFLFTLLAINFIDKIGRRKLMFIGSLGLIATLGLVAQAFYAKNFNGWGVTVFLLVYIAFFAFSQGAVIWVFISEIFPNHVRAKGQTLGGTTHWVMAALVAFSFPMLAEKLGGGHTFLFFCVMMVLQLLFVWKVMPETKGKSLEQIEQTLVLH